MVLTALASAVLASALALLAPPAPPPGDTPRVDPQAAKPGVVGAWQAKDGLKYEYLVPADYNAEKGANLTLVLHGNGLDERWTFLNHPAGEFRAADIVVSPDGTTFTKGTNANEFLGENKDAARFRALLLELKKIWNVRQTFLYGHSQGSFFVFYYAGAYPDDVDGVCGHASGVWNWTTTGTKGRRQAIGLMHGTADGNVPYGQSWWGRKHYVEQKYPRVHLRTLFDWSHQPAWSQAELQLAWCEGITSEDLARVDASLTTLGNPAVSLGIDWAALWAVADRLAHEKAATDAQRARGEKVAAKVDELAGKHIETIEAALGEKGVNQLKKLGTAGHAGHVVRFLEDFDGVPRRDEWVEKNKAVFKALQSEAEEHYTDYRRDVDHDPAKAFKAALALLETGYTHYDVPTVLSVLDRWVKQGALSLSDADSKRFAELAEGYREGRKTGFAEFTALNEGVNPLE